MTSATNGYDFIVVGGGTAGCVLAARLSERGDARVLLLEAGAGRPLEAMSTPPAWRSLLQSPANWGDVTIEQAATGTRVALPRGRGLGGSSSINGMIFARGHRSSYDSWKVDGWSFDDLLPYFKRTENAPGRDPALRGLGGPLTITTVDPVTPVLAACLEGARETTGHRMASDVGGGLEEGFGPVDLNIAGGRRQSAADAYLTPALGRPNLRVVTGALVHRLRFAGGRCFGVEYSTEGLLDFAACSGEVVLAAGAIGSAHHLLQSGIGPSAHLREHDIEVTANLPGVGANLHDHPAAYLAYRSARPIQPARFNHGEAFGLVRSEPALDGPDLQILLLDEAGHVDTGLGAEHGYTISIAIMRPYSRGTLRLGGPEPGIPPVLDPGYYSDGRDLAAMVRGLRIARGIAHAGALASWRKEAISEPATVEDDDLRAYALANLSSYFHPVGTCRMGDDDLAVVGGDLRVHGLSGLRVADGSVIPAIPSANTNATVYAIAERAADLI